MYMCTRFFTSISKFESRLDKAYFKTKKLDRKIEIWARSGAGVAYSRDTYVKKTRVHLAVFVRVYVYVSVNLIVGVACVCGYLCVSVAGSLSVYD